jgi:TonB family protein
MNSNEGRPTAPGDQDDYEATVLDFLDREMATVQQTQASNQQSDELDALVSDLLKQVITETDQTQSADKPLFDEDELFAGLTSGLQKPSGASHDPLVYSVPSTPSTLEEIALPAAKSAAETLDPLPESAATRSATAAIFGSSTAAASRKFPVKAVAALAGLVAVIGAAAYLFSDKSGKVTESQPPAAQVAKSTLPVVPAASQPVAKPAATQANSAGTSKSNATPAPKPGSVVPTKSATQQPSVKPSVVNTKPDPEPPKVANEEKTPAPQSVPAAMAPAPAAPAAEKQASQPAVETSSPVIPERKPVPSPQVANLINEPPSPSPASASTASASHSLTAAVPIAQASPVYPELALRTRASGQVVMELQIDDQGKVIKAAVMSGPAIFYGAAVDAAMKWRYKPASISGVNVASQSRVTMSFNLKK